MSWMVFAFSGPVLWAISTHFDKYLVDKYFRTANVAVLLIFTALMGLIALPFIWYIEPRVFHVGYKTAVVMAGSGIVFMGALLLYLRALQGNEASVVAPFFQASPLMGFILAYVVLGETLSRMQMLGGALIVGGAAFASIRFGGGARFNKQVAVLMLGCAVAVAVSSLIFKIFAVRDEFWTTTFWMYAGQALFGIAMLAIGSYRREFVALLKRSPGPVISVNAANELINLGGGLGNRYALVLAPLSLVQAVGGATLIFVFIFGVLLTVFVPSFSRENLAGAELARKGFAAVLVAAGVALINH